MANDTNPQTTTASKAPPSALRKSLPYLAFLVAVAGALIYFNSDGYKIATAISGLHSDNPKTRRERLTIIRTHPNKALVNEKLLAALDDDDYTWRVQRMCAAELLARERLAELETVLKTGSLGAKSVVLHVFHNKPFFKSAYLEDDEYKIYDTLSAWLRDEGNTHRAEAIQIVKLLQWREGLPLIRPLLRRSDDPSTHPHAESFMLQAAASAVSFFDDCESIPALRELIESDFNGKVRMRALQELHRVVFERDACPGGIPEESMKALIAGRLHDDDRATRMAAMLIYKKQPAWAAESEAAMHAILNDLGRGSPERRLALEVLVTIGSDEFLKELPRWFYDATPEVRSSAAQVVGKFDDRANPFLGSLIGVVRNETQNASAFRAATRQLHMAAGMWKGLPTKIATAKRNVVQPVLDGMFANGEGAGVTRHQFARGWFLYHAEQLGLDELQRTEAAELFDAFWKAADANDVAVATSVLDGDRYGKQGLFADARGWLAAK